MHRWGIVCGGMVIAILSAAVGAQVQAAGPHWSIVARAGGTAPGGSLTAVSCPIATACTAVGYQTNAAGIKSRTLAEGWNGSSWSVQSTPDPPGGSRIALTGVACAAPAACTAVGGYADATNTVVTLAEAWNGASWTIQPTADPPGALDSTLAGVACPTRNFCTAVGSFANNRTAQTTLAESWDGTTWTVDPTPLPPGARYGELTAVACTTATACVAVGDSSTPSHSRSLAEVWNGTSWTILPTPNPAGAWLTVLSGVACPTPTACTAVGYSQPSAGTAATLVEAWDGSSWTIQPTPNPSVAVGSDLTGVSCTSATACKAVGSYDTSSRGSTLAESWDGTSWRIQPTPNPAGASTSILIGVACTAAAACLAVGDTTRAVGDARHTLSERYS